MNYIMNEMTVKEFKKVLEKTKTAVLPVGVVEQHGYHLPLGTDTMIASELTKRASCKMNAVVLPTIQYCFSGGELPGTINISPQLFSLIVTDIILELAKTGFKNVVIYLAHGGTDNTTALKGSIKMVLKRYTELRKMTISIVSLVKFSKSSRENSRIGSEHDFHSGLVETSLMMYLKPELVKIKDLEMDDEHTARMMRTDQDWFEKSEKVINHEFVVPNVYQREEIKVGVMGFPEKASRELGEKITNEVIEGLAEYVNFIDKENR